jgi:DNA repair exonuclease SbcCD ATPase subunit
MMDLDQLIKRLEWLDDERRKDKTIIATLEERLNRLEGNLPPLGMQIKAVEGEVTRMTAFLTRLDQIDAAIAQIRVDYARSIEAVEKQRVERERESERGHRADMETLTKTIAEVRKGLDPIPDLKKNIQSRAEEDFRLGRLIEELDHKIDESNRGDEEYKRAIKLLDEGRRQDTKRITDMTSEVVTLRKRLDEHRGKVDLSADAVRKVELRVNEVQAAESERRQAQAAFIDRQNMLVVERDRVWKDWQVRFEEILRQATNLDTQMQSLDATHRAVKRSQESFEEITQRFERRVNEITEMQRLVEERFRQEWVTFKSDDQKRWTNYTLAQEEQQREITRQFEKYAGRIVELEDITQEMRDLLQQVVEENQKRLQTMLAVYHESVEEFERTFGRNR